MAFRLRGPLEVSALESALRAIVRRHAILRTRIDTTDGLPMQRITSDLGLFAENAEYTDGGPVDSPIARRIDRSRFLGDREAEVLRLAREEARQPFDLERGPLVRFCLVVLADGDHVLLVTAHHIVWDWGSTGILFRELSGHYAALRAGQGSEIEELALQYADFARGQARFKGDPAFTRQFDYWRARLAGLDPLELPTDFQRPEIQGYSSDVLDCPIPAALAQGLRELANRRSTSLATLLCAAFQLLLARIAGVEDIAVGVPVSQRTTPELEPVIGVMLNTLVIRTAMGQDLSFADELLPRVHESMLTAYENQEVPFELLAAELDARRDPSRHPLHQVMFSMLPHRRGALLLDDVEVTPLGRSRDGPELVDSASLHTALDLELRVIEHPGGLLARLVFDDELFTRDRIERLARSFRCLLEQILARPCARLSQLSLVDAAQLSMLRRWSDGMTVPGCDGRSVPELFDARARLVPSAIALIDHESGARMSFDELEAQASSLAAWLQGQGVECREAVGLYMKRSPATVVAMLGVMKAGCAFLPLDHELSTERLAGMLADAGAKLVLVQPSWGERLAGIEVRLRELDLGSLNARGPAWQCPGVSGADPAYVLFTSGSSGRPKGVVGTHRGLVNRISWEERVAPWGPDEVACFKTRGAFVDSVAEVLCPLCAGVPLVILSEDVVADPRAFLAALHDREVTRIVLVPSQLEELLEAFSDASGEGQGLLPRLEQWTLSGEPLSWKLALRLLDVAPGAHLRNLYGSTEVAADATVQVVQAEDARPGDVPIGRPIDNVIVRVLDAWCQPVPVGVPGELWVGGVGVASGYLALPEETAARFVPDPLSTSDGQLNGTIFFRSGDRARWRSDGVLECLGRVDTQVKVRGVRIELGEVESVLATHPAVAQVVAAVRERPLGGDLGKQRDEPRLVAYVVARKGASRVGLLEFARAELPVAAVPSVLVWLDELPRTPSGKLDRGALPDPVDEFHDAEAVGPREGLEEVLCAIWSDLLGREYVGVHADFFALGGHSLLAARLAARVRAALGKELSVRQLFLNPTVASLAAHLRGLSEESVDRSTASDDPLLVRAAESEFSSEGEQSAPMSFAQERLWVLDRMGAGDAQHLPMALAWHGALRFDALQRALAELVRRHAGLRTGLGLVDGAAVQRIRSTCEVALERVDLTHVEPAERPEKLQRLAEAQARAPFDLAQPPLLRASLVTLGDDEHVLLLTLHHAVGDAWSLDLLRRELVRLYEAFRDGAPSPLPQPAIRYADFARWQRACLRGPRLERDLTFWRAVLSDLPELQLPTDRVRPPEKSYRSALRDFEIDPRIVRGLRALAQREGATLAMVLLGAWQAFLARICDERDVAVGVPVAGRARVEFESVLGMFVNPIILRVKLSSDPRFASELLVQVRRACLAAYEHQDVPFEVLVRDLNPERDPSRHPFVQVAFTLQNATSGPASESTATYGVAGESFTVEPLALAAPRTAFDLDLRVLDRGERLPARLLFDPSLFTADTVAGLAERFQRVLEGIVRAPEARLSELDLFTPGEREELFARAHGPVVGEPQSRCAFQLFEERARERGADVGLVWGELSLDYRTLEQRANGLSHELVRRGAGPGATVGIALERSPELVIALLAVHKAGAAYLPLDPGPGGDPEPRLAAKLASGAPELILTHETLRTFLPHDIPLLVLDGEVPEALAAPAVDVRSSQLAYVTHTSGSTGVPKAVEVEHRGLANLIGFMARELRLGPGDTWLSVTPVSFDIAALELFGPLAAGARITLADRQTSGDPRALAVALDRSGANVCQATPVTWQMLVDSGWKAARPLRVLCGGESLPGDLARSLRADPNITLMNLYGPTETTIWSTLEHVESDPVTIGRAVANTQVYVLDRELQPVPPGVPGELWIGGDGVGRGYRGAPRSTAERYRPNPFVALAEGEAPGRIYGTGDRVRWLADGRIEHLGRWDDQLKLRGHRIEAGEIEAALREHPSVHEAAVVLQGRALEAALVAHVVLTRETRCSEHELRTFLRDRLPALMVPARYVFREAMPRNERGKLVRSKLHGAPAVVAEALGREPETPLERALARIWCERLGLDRVGLHDRFLDLGGHSLAAVAVVDTVEAELGIRLRPMELLFADLAQLAAQCEKLGAVVQQDELGAERSETVSWLTRFLARFRGRRA